MKNIDLTYRTLPCFYSEELDEIIGYTPEINFILKLMMFIDEKILKLEEPPITVGFSSEHELIEILLNL